MILERTVVESPMGPIAVFSRDGACVAVGFAEQEAGLVRRFPSPTVRDVPTSPPAEAIARYLAGDLDALRDVTVSPAGTPFQQAVWSQLRAIAPGETLSYAELAERVGRPTAVRAVAQANARNPVSLVVPCHRVIGKDGALTGYAGGTSRKQWLLRHEGAKVEANDRRV